MKPKGVVKAKPKDEKPKITKCDVKKGIFCFVMEKMLEPEDNAHHRKGLTRLIILNFDKGTQALWGVSYGRGRSDPGVMLNYCPWCGASLKNWRKGKKSA